MVKEPTSIGEGNKGNDTGLVQDATAQPKSYVEAPAAGHHAGNEPAWRLTGDASHRGDADSSGHPHSQGGAYWERGRRPVSVRASPHRVSVITWVIRQPR